MGNLPSSVGLKSSPGGRKIQQMLGVQKKTKGYEAASAPLNMLMRARQYATGEPVDMWEKVVHFICPSLLLIYLYQLIQSCLVLRNMEWLSIAYYVEKVGRILLIVDSGSGKAYRMDFRCVSGGSHKRNTQMVQILRLTDGNCIGMRFLHSASLQSK